MSENVITYVSKKGNVTIPAQTEPLDYTRPTKNDPTKTETIRTRLRYCEGEQSLIPSEQSVHAKPKPIRFNGISLRADKSDYLLNDYLKHTPSFLSGFISIHNPSKLVNDKVNERIKFHEAEKLIVEANEVSRFVAYFVEVGKKAVGKSADYIQQELFKLLDDSTPEKIISLFKDVNTDIELTASAIYREVIQYEGGKYIWYGQKHNVIFEVPKGKDYTEAFAEFLNTNEGKVVKKEIVLKVNKEFVPQKQAPILTNISGIGDGVKKTLNAIGILSVSDLANETEESINTKLTNRALQIKSPNLNLGQWIADAKTMLE